MKYAGLDGRCLLSLPSRTWGVTSASTPQLLSYLGRRLSDITGESRETSYLHGLLDIPNFLYIFLIFKPPSGSWLPRVNTTSSTTTTTTNNNNNNNNNNRKVSFFFNGCRSHCNVSMPFCCTRALSRAGSRTSSHFS